MPLKPGKKNIGKNITELKKANASKLASKKRSEKQILAIALSKAGQTKEKKDEKSKTKT